MSRYTGSEYKRSRSVGFSTTETGKELARRPHRPGQHGADTGRPISLLYRRVRCRGHDRP